MYATQQIHRYHIRHRDIRIYQLIAQRQTFSQAVMISKSMMVAEKAQILSQNLNTSSKPRAKQTQITLEKILHIFKIKFREAFSKS